MIRAISYSLDTIKSEARQLVDSGIIDRQQPILHSLSIYSSS
jgi:hypothetical protein